MPTAFVAINSYLNGLISHTTALRGTLIIWWQHLSKLDTDILLPIYISHIREDLFCILVWTGYEALYAANAMLVRFVGHFDFRPNYR